MANNQKHVCVIGSGSAGLTSIKQCLDGGLLVTCYEKTDNIGGLWRYRDEDKDGLASVMRSTIINSSKEMSAFSDFPPPEDWPNYMHNSKMVQYFELYADKFNLHQSVKFNHEVLQVERAEDHDDTGRWQVTVRDNTDKRISTKVFDAVLVCTGHHVHPSVPVFEGQKEFKGKIVHSHSYKTPDQFVGKTVVVSAFQKANKPFVNVCSR